LSLEGKVEISFKNLRNIFNISLKDKKVQVQK